MPKKFPVPREEQTEHYWKVLNEVIDPEVGIGLVDLGLIYDVEIDKKGLATIKMTLTSPSCPVGPVLVQQVEDIMVVEIEEVKRAQVEIVWEPMWTSEKIDPDLKELMFGL